MSFSTAKFKQAFKELQESHITPWFKEQGFRKSGKTYYRIGETVAYTVTVEFSRFNTIHLYNFWFNVNMWVGDFSESTSANAVQKDGFAAYHKRLGALWSQSAHMYTLTLDETEQATLATEIQGHLAEYLPSLLKEYEDGIEYVESLIAKHKDEPATENQAFPIAMCFIKLGWMDEAKPWFGRMAGDPQQIKKAAAFYGIQL